MLSIIGSVLSMGAPLIIWGIKTFVGNKITREKYVKNYHDMIAKHSARGATKVANYIAAEASLAHVQMQIREERLQEPTRGPAGEIVTSSKQRYTIPLIVDVQTEVETHGTYLTELGRARGLIVHYTSGRFDKGADNAQDTLRDLAKRGFGCLVMDIDGIIYKAANQKMNEIAWHAGDSGWLGVTGLSRYCFGMEICNAGRLSKEPHGESWFGQKIATKNTRHVEKNANQAAGLYHKFSKEQEKSLLNFVLWQLDVNPEFQTDWVMGHDECAPGRKQDPGGSLSMTMPDFRSMITKKFLK